MDVIVDFIFMTEYAIQLLAAEAVCALPLDKRKHFPVRFAAFAVLAIVIFRLLRFAEDSLALIGASRVALAGWAYLIAFVLTVFGMKFCYKNSLWSLLFCASAAQAMQHTAHRVRDLLLNLLPLAKTKLNYIWLAIVVCVAVYAIFYFMFLRNLKHRKFPNLNNKKMTLTITACIGISFFIGVHGRFETAVNYIIFDVAMILACFFILCYQFGFLGDSYRQAELEAMRLMLREAQTQFDAKSESIDLINGKCHDIKKLIREYGAKIRMDENSLREITDAVNIYDSTADTGNKTLDIIITDKTLYCERNNIQLGCMVKGDNLAFMKPMDTYSLFGNILDNAIEAVRKLDDANKAIIGLSVNVKDDLLFIHCENFYRDTLEFADALPRTTKDDSDNHGYGLKSVRYVVEKYGGIMNILPQDGVFNVNIVIPVRSAD